jgi:hypothetical protein
MSAAVERQLLYVASPGTRNYVENGGVGILVFDSDNGYKFVRRVVNSLAERPLVKWAPVPYLCAETLQ